MGAHVRVPPFREPYQELLVVGSAPQGLGIALCTSDRQRLLCGRLTAPLLLDILARLPEPEAEGG